MKHENRFGEFIANLRKERGISQEQLSEGLCSPSMLCKFENGEREAEKLLQNRFLTRLGAVPENYENFLFYEEYCHWEKRQGILYNILEEDMAQAKLLLEEYRTCYDMKDALEQQFYLAMLAQIKRYEGSTKEELAELFGKALDLTVPQVERYGVMQRVLSLEELNLLLEYVYCSASGLERYEEILAYVEKMERTILAQAKIFPKTVYYYYEAWEQSKEEQKRSPADMLELCNRAIEVLRDANRMFYLWELFCMKERLTPLLPDEIRKQEEFQTSLLECRGWRETLEELYRDYGVTIAMYEFCYLYVGSENYCIGDVIRIRRKMLGISQEKLGENLCDSRTISKLERNKSKSHKEVVQCLFERLNLSTELNRTELVTDNQEAIEKYRELRNQNNNNNFLKVELLLAELKKLLSLDVPSNKQIILRNQAINSRNKDISKKNIEISSTKKYIESLREALECTVPYSAVVSGTEIYLTNEEVSCIQNIMVEMNEAFPEVEECIPILMKLCENPRYSSNYVRMYEFIMTAIASYLGNCKRYDSSDEIEKKIIKLLLKNRRLGGIHEALYEIVWNNEQKNKVCYLKKRDATEIQKCIRMSRLCKDEYRFQMYLDKIREIYGMGNV